MKRDTAIKSLKQQTAALKALGATSLYLFGSTSRNSATAKSDLDLFLDYNPRGNFSALDLVAAKRLLEGKLRTRVDLTTRAGLHPLIRKNIEREAVRIF